ncbi:hypothetical protein [Microbacterium lacticum]
MDTRGGVDAAQAATRGQESLERGNKTGTISTVRADTGLVMSPTGRVAYAVLVNWPSGALARDEALAVMRTAGDVLRSWLRG